MSVTKRLEPHHERLDGFLAEIVLGLRLAQPVRLPTKAADANSLAVSILLSTALTPHPRPGSTISPAGNVT